MIHEKIAQFIHHYFYHSILHELLMQTIETHLLFSTISRNFIQIVFYAGKAHTYPTRFTKYFHIGNDALASELSSSLYK